MVNSHLKKHCKHLPLVTRYSQDPCLFSHTDLEIFSLTMNTMDIFSFTKNTDVLNTTRPSAVFPGFPIPPLKVDQPPAMVLNYKDMKPHGFTSQSDFLWAMNFARRSKEAQEVLAKIGALENAYLENASYWGAGNYSMGLDNPVASEVPDHIAKKIFGLAEELYCRSTTVFSIQILGRDVYFHDPRFNECVLKHFSNVALLRTTWSSLVNMLHTLFPAVLVWHKYLKANPDVLGVFPEVSDWMMYFISRIYPKEDIPAVLHYVMTFSCTHFDELFSDTMMKKGFGQCVYDFPPPPANVYGRIRNMLLARCSSPSPSPFVSVPAILNYIGRESYDQDEPLLDFSKQLPGMVLLEGKQAPLFVLIEPLKRRGGGGRRRKALSTTERGKRWRQRQQEQDEEEHRKKEAARKKEYRARVREEDPAAFKKKQAEDKRVQREAIKKKKHRAKARKENPGASKKAQRKAK